MDLDQWERLQALADLDSDDDTWELGIQDRAAIAAALKRIKQLEDENAALTAALHREAR